MIYTILFKKKATFKTLFKLLLKLLLIKITFKEHTLYVLKIKLIKLKLNILQKERNKKLKIIRRFSAKFLKLQIKFIK